MADKTKILSNAATLLIGEAGGAVADVGYTRGGVSVAKTYDSRKIEADQTRFALYTQTTGEGYDINFRLLEITPGNLEDGWGEGGTAGVDSLSLGVWSDNPPEKEIQMYAKRKDGKYVKFTFYDCVLTSAGDFGFSKDDEALIESTYTALYDDDESCCGLMEITDTV